MSLAGGCGVHQQPCCHMPLGGSVIQTEMPVSLSRHRGSRLASPAGDQEGSSAIATGYSLNTGIRRRQPDRRPLQRLSIFECRLEGRAALNVLTLVSRCVYLWTEPQTGKTESWLQWAAGCYSPTAVAEAEAACLSPRTCPRHQGAFRTSPTWAWGSSLSACPAGSAPGAARRRTRTHNRFLPGPQQLALLWQVPQLYSNNWATIVFGGWPVFRLVGWSRHAGKWYR